MSMALRRRWSDNDRYFGPLTYSKDDRAHWQFAVVLCSGDGDDYPGCSLRMSGFGHTFIVGLPALLKPWRRWVDTSRHEWSKSPNEGYWDAHQQQFGFSVSEGFLQVFLGAQTHDSETTRSWSKFLPWTQWRFVRFSLYDLDGNLAWTALQQRKGGRNFEARREAEDALPKLTLAFRDFDGEELSATTHIAEHEWHFGEGWFKWLSLLRRPKMRRSLDIKFSGETGERKGSWKGGTTGHSIDMLPDELHEAAFRRYCAEHSMTFIG